jgi:hypothetical protein
VGGQRVDLVALLQEGLRCRLAVLYRAWLPAERDADTRLFRF